jgi:Fungal rhodopsin domain
MFVSVGYSLSGAFANVFFCHPISRLWDYSVPGTCVQIGEVFLALAAFNAATDVTMLLLPIWLLWPLTLPTRTKIGVVLILMTGSL